MTIRNKLGLLLAIIMMAGFILPYIVLAETDVPDDAPVEVEQPAVSSVEPTATSPSPTADITESPTSLPSDVPETTESTDVPVQSTPVQSVTPQPSESLVESPMPSATPSPTMAADDTPEPSATPAVSPDTEPTASPIASDVPEDTPTPTGEVLALEADTMMRASVNTPDGFIFDTETGIITGYTGTASTVVIPNSIDGVDVVAIGENAFASNTTMYSLMIIEGSVRIERNAFRGCTELMEVSLFSSVTYIGDYAFEGCTRLMELEMSSALLSMGVEVFKNCTMLNIVALQKSPMTVLPAGTFSNCSNLGSINIRENFTTIGDEAFSGCTQLTRIDIAGTVNQIGGNAFTGASNVHMYGELGSYAQTYATQNSIPFTVTFDSGLQYTQHPDYTCTITGYTGGETSLAIPEIIYGHQVTQIAANAFDGCNTLTEITVPATVTTIGADAFLACEALANIVVDGDNPNYCSTGSFISGVLMSKDKTELIRVPMNRDDYSSSIPSTVTSIHSKAYYGSKHLRFVEIGLNVVNIGESAFSACEQLEHISSLDNHSTFYSYNGVLYTKDRTRLIQYPNACARNNFSIPDNVTQIDADAFRRSTILINLTIHSNVTSIGNNAFADCPNLVFYGTRDSVAHLYAVENGIPFMEELASGIQYRDQGDGTCAITGYTGTATELVIPDEIDGKTVVRIAKEAFYNADIDPSFTSITLPNTLEVIEDHAFRSCDNLTSLSVPASVRDIGIAITWLCRNLTDINVDPANQYYQSVNGVLYTKDGTRLLQYPNGKTDIRFDILDGVTHLGPYSVGYNAHLEMLVMPNSITHVEKNAVREFRELINIQWSNQLEVIGERAFAFCYKLQQIELPDSVREVGVGAFEECSELRNILLPMNLTEIKSRTFLMCEKLEPIIIPRGVTTIGDSVWIPSGTTVLDHVQVIGENAFRGSINVMAGTYAHQYAIDNNMTFTIIDNPHIQYTSNGDGTCTITGYTGSETSLDIPENIGGHQVTQIAANAFNGCNTLTEITVPATVTMIGVDAFLECEALASIIVDGNNPNYSSSNGLLLSKDGSILIRVPMANVYAKDGHILPGVSVFGPKAYYGHHELRWILINKDIIHIGEQALSACPKLESFSVSDENGEYKIIYGSPEVLVTKITGEFIQYPIGKTVSSYTVPSEIIQIHAGAFRDEPDLQRVTIHENVTSIGDDAFAGCSNLTIYGYTGSYAETYASNNGIPFAPMLPSGLQYEDQGDGTCRIVGFAGSATELIIPDTIEGMTVTTIGVEAFGSNSHNITSLLLPDTIESIGDGAFKGCYALATIDIPVNVSYIGDGILQACRDLTTITVAPSNTSYHAVDGVLFNETGSILIQYPAGKTDTSYTVPDGVTHLAPYAMGYNRHVESIVFPNTLTHIGNNGVVNCGNLSSITWPSQLEVIGDYAFSVSSGMTELQLPNTVHTIGKGAFSWWGRLRNVVLPEALTSLQDETFAVCEGLKTVTISTNLSSIGIRVFLECPNLSAINVNSNNPYLQSINGVLYSKDGTRLIRCPSNVGITSFVVPMGVTHIENEAFHFCHSLTSIELPDSLISIGENAFGACFSLTEMTVLDQVHTIEQDAFRNAAFNINVCEGSVAHQYVQDNSLNYTVIVNPRIQYVSNRDGTCTIIGYTGMAPTLLIPSTINGDVVIEVWHDAFNGQATLTQIDLPNTLERIGASAFINCTALETMVIPEGVTSLPQRAFSGCTQLTSITLSTGLESIWDRAFDGCSSLESVEIPSSVTAIGDWAFTGCNGMTQYQVASGNTSYQSVDGVLMTYDGEVLINYPLANPRTAYTVPDGVTNILNQAFYAAVHLQEVDIPASVNAIGYSAFASCRQLTDIHVSKDNAIFQSIQGILMSKDGLLLIQYPAGKHHESFLIPYCVATIGTMAFSECDYLRDIVIPEHVTMIEFPAFMGCDDITIHGVTGSAAFDYATANSIPFEEMPGDDVNDDGTIDMLDLIEVAQSYSSSAVNVDFNLDNIVNLFDLLFISIRMN